MEPNEEISEIISNMLLNKIATKLVQLNTMYPHGYHQYLSRSYDIPNSEETVTIVKLDDHGIVVNFASEFDRQNGIRSADNWLIRPDLIKGYHLPPNYLEWGMYSLNTDEIIRVLIYNNIGWGLLSQVFVSGTKLQTASGYSKKIKPILKHPLNSGHHF